MPNDTLPASGAAELALRPFLGPRYWPTWAFVGALGLASLLPYRMQLGLGRAIGRLAMRLMPKHRHIAAVNLELCFPALTAAERETLLARHFEAFGVSFFEMANGWFASRRRLERLVELRGTEHLDAARAAGRGVLLLTAHFTPLETCVGALERLEGPFSGLYSPQRNGLIDIMIRRGRARTLVRQIARDNVRGVIRALRDGHVVLYLPDQTYLGNQSVLLPFFGEPAVTNTAPPKLARISGAAVMTFYFERRPGSRGYRAEILPLPEGFPTDDETADTQRLVERLEQAILAAPEQYLWTYRKFKARPAPYEDPYRRRRRRETRAG